MRVYISADMEGVTGLVDSQDVQLGGGEYEYGRAMMTEALQHLRKMQSEQRKRAPRPQ